MSCDLSVTNQAAQSIEPLQSVSSVPVEQSWFTLSLLTLLRATWPLWGGTADFPRVPMWHGFDVGGFLQRLLLALLPVMLLPLLVGLWPWPSRLQTVLAERRLTRWSWMAVLLTLSVLVLQDQNRLQPWVWHAVLVSAYSIGTCHDRRRWCHGIMLLTVTIYGWSAVSKLDVSFETTYGQQLVEALLGPDRVMSFRLLKPHDRAFVARLLPLGELLAAGLLLVPFTRRAGCVLAIGMHMGLMLAVGPWGLNHRAGVFLWNVYFMGQHIWLWFALGRTQRSSFRHWLHWIGERVRERSFAGSCCVVARSTGKQLCPRNTSDGVLWFALLFPALRTLELCDNWPAWAVYASDVELVTVYVRDDVLERLPLRARSFAETSAVKTGWTAIRIERWSLAECHAPIYPQARYSISIALALTEAARLEEGDLVVLIRSRPDSQTGLRSEIRLRGSSELRQFAGRFWLNVLARPSSVQDGYLR